MLCNEIMLRPFQVHEYRCQLRPEAVLKRICCPQVRFQLHALNSRLLNNHCIDLFKRKYLTLQNIRNAKVKNERTK
jgi:hypothetical protein